MKVAWRIGLASLIVAASCSAATLVRAPYLQNVSTEGATILWATSGPGRGAVEYSADGEPFHAATAQVREFLPHATSRHTFQHEVELKGLRPGREYSYRVLVDGAVLKDGLSFRTSGPGPFVFLAFGDSGTGSAVQRRLAERMTEKENPAFVLHAGDLSQENGDFDHLEAVYFKVYAELMSRTPFFPTPGNHDYWTDYGAPYRAVHSPPRANVAVQDAGRYYSFDWSNAHFISLDTNLLEFTEDAQRMLEWLERDLQRQTKFWKVAYFHHPPYPTGHHRQNEISAMVRERVLPVLERHGVQLVLNGHEHSYQRSVPLRGGEPAEDGSGTAYIITAGGGAGFHAINPAPTVAFGASVHHYLRCEVRDSQLTITAIGEDGREIDSVTLAPPPRISAGGVVSAASLSGALAPGSLISVFGSNLAFEAAAAPGPRLPTALSGTEVRLNGRPVPLVSVSPGRIDAQLPYGVTGPATLGVHAPNSSVEISLFLARAAPAIVHETDGSNSVPSIVRLSTGDLITIDSPAKRGEAMAVRVTGLGAVNGDIDAGDPCPAWPPLTAREAVEIRIGDVVLKSSFAALSPGRVGVYEVNVRIPLDLRNGVYDLRVTAGGISSDPVKLWVGVRSRTD